MLHLIAILFISGTVLLLVKEINIGTAPIGLSTDTSADNNAKNPINSCAKIKTLLKIQLNK